MHLDNYSGMWIALALLSLLCAVFAAFVLQETSLAKPCTLRFCANRCFGRGGNILTDASNALRVVWRDPFVRCSMIPTNILMSAGTYGSLSITGGWGTSVCEYGQGTTAFMGVVQPLAIVLGSLASSCAVHAVGPWIAAAFGLLVCTIGLVLT